MDEIHIPYRLEMLVSNLYKVDTISKVNYAQYLPPNNDDQWSIQMELTLRRRDRSVLVALLSRELWCFSVNDDPLPKLTATEKITDLSAEANNDTSPVTANKSGEFTSDYSKPNLPPHYALFLKALRKVIYINLATNSNNQLIQYGNACVSLLQDPSGRSNPLLQLEPHLFANGDLTVSISTKDIGLIKLTEDDLREEFLKEHALYLAPSGIRMYLPSNTNKQQILCKAPPNAATLLETLSVSHGITLVDNGDMKWVKVIPHLGHLNGYTPSIASYMKPPTNPRKIVWPLELCFAQPATVVSKGASDCSIHQDLNGMMDLVDDFIQVKQTSAYRTPGSSGALNTNPMSSGGGYTEQFQQSYRNLANTTNNAGSFPMSNPPATKHSPLASLPVSHESKDSAHIPDTVNSANGLTLANNLLLSPNLTTAMEKGGVNGRQDSFNLEFSHTPSTNGHANNQLFSIDKKQTNEPSTISPVKGDIGYGLIMDTVIPGTNGSQDQPHSETQEDVQEEPADDKELFGDDDDDDDDDNNTAMTDTMDVDQPKLKREPNGEAGDDDDLFGDINDNDNSSPSAEKTFHGVKTSDEITEDMFGMSDDEENGNSKAGTSRNSNEAPQSRDQASSEYFDYQKPPIRRFMKPGTKRKYTDIPFEEITLSNSPLYMDPGAPLPVDTPRDRRRSVFAPLNFNPIIENNVDNKYKNGGKFSISPAQKEDAFKFDVSTGDFSTSDEEDSDSSLESFDYNNAKQDLKSFEGSVHDSQFLNYQNVATGHDSVATGLLSNNDNIGTEPYMKDGSEGIWKISHNEIPQTDSPLKPVDASLQPIYNNLTENLSPESMAGSILQNKEKPLKKEEEKQLDILGAERGTDLTRCHINAENSEEKLPFNSLPFLLRHIPLSSIPDVFLDNNPKIRLSRKNQDILDLLAEQIIFDHGLLGSFNIPEIRYDDILVDKDGFIANTMEQIFPNFQNILGSDIISKIYPMKQPFVYAKKQHEIIKIKTDAQPFAQFLNIRSAMGIKNFKLLLLTTSYKDDCALFNSTLSQTYINHEFGFCELLTLTSEVVNGLIYLKDFDKNKLMLLAAQIVSYCTTNKKTEKDVMLMILLPLKDNTLNEILTNINVFQIIRNEVRAKIPNMDLFLKVIPLDFIKNPLTSVDDYYSVCASIYNVLLPKKTKFTAIAHKLPDKVEFRTLPQGNAPSFINYDSYIHLSYSRSVDKQWMFGVLTDSEGKNTSVRTWYIGGSKRLFDEVCNKLWTLALSLATTKYGKICLILTRLSGILPDDELMNWRRLSGRNIHLAVVCVDDNTKISFYDQDAVYPSFKPIFKDAKLARPYDESALDDYEIRDVDDDVHGVIFQNPFPLANSQHRCAIRSGALIKFKRTHGDAMWDKLEVNLLNCPHSDSTNLLEKILEEFRNLAALNVWFGVSNGEDSHIPWHVLAVKKMMKSMVYTQVEVISE
ncbi:Ssn2p KNAG_0C03050 [Huiozyma naganishii CBS 8797]|uniref:Mediator of RNA polymerase II transcription subunit 13 n=1 Tax=Huiozyma naganishii (strain ATCC MYA-139 / BCRC 22969 / CBS 8797 / KCTC 17520 / NBRC 10181 / NCYC 3082 / Yp74L-3) TaxID=1071383 RepID=J7S5X3_HUIN7|nr:hypothetical protein KNAG_0C03050 [Kazachstania naganishii CBS 8797]CCK69416.1 hypothetical protein KNAG_0C03050 [Kazachstania naganishii CBS 8797]